MTADMTGPTNEIDAPLADDEVLPPEWLEWAQAVERREDLRFRVARKPDRVRLAEAVAQHSASGGMLDWTDETLEFVAWLRAGADRPELHHQPRRWGITRSS